MTNYELQALRKRLMLETGEAAKHIGQCSPRTWQYWESGRNNVPTDVADQMTDLSQILEQTLEARQEQFAKANGEKIDLSFYQNLKSFTTATGKANVVMWRLSQSVAAQMYSNGSANLVEIGGLAIDEKAKLS